MTKSRKTQPEIKDTYTHHCFNSIIIILTKPRTNIAEVSNKCDVYEHFVGGSIFANSFSQQILSLYVYHAVQPVLSPLHNKRTAIEDEYWIYTVRVLLIERKYPQQYYNQKNDIKKQSINQSISSIYFWNQVVGTLRHIIRWYIVVLPSGVCMWRMMVMIRKKIITFDKNYDYDWIMIIMVTNELTH